MPVGVAQVYAPFDASCIITLLLMIITGMGTWMYCRRHETYVQWFNRRLCAFYSSIMDANCGMSNLLNSSTEVLGACDKLLTRFADLVRTCNYLPERLNASPEADHKRQREKDEAAHTIQGLAVSGVVALAHRFLSITEQWSSRQSASPSTVAAVPVSATSPAAAAVKPTNTSCGSKSGSSGLGCLGEQKKQAVESKYGSPSSREVGDVKSQLGREQKTHTHADAKTDRTAPIRVPPVSTSTTPPPKCARVGDTNCGACCFSNSCEGRPNACISSANGDVSSSSRCHRQSNNCNGQKRHARQSWDVSPTTIVCVHGTDHGCNRADSESIRVTLQPLISGAALSSAESAEYHRASSDDPASYFRNLAARSILQSLTSSTRVVDQAAPTSAGAATTSTGNVSSSATASPVVDPATALSIIQAMQNVKQAPGRALDSKTMAAPFDRVMQDLLLAHRQAGAAVDSKTAGVGAVPSVPSSVICGTSAPAPTARVTVSNIGAAAPSSGDTTSLGTDAAAQPSASKTSS